MCDAATSTNSPAIFLTDLSRIPDALRRERLRMRRRGVTGPSPQPSPRERPRAGRGRDPAKREGEGEPRGRGEALQIVFRGLPGGKGDPAPARPVAGNGVVRVAVLPPADALAVGRFDPHGMTLGHNECFGRDV